MINAPGQGTSSQNQQTYKYKYGVFEQEVHWKLTFSTLCSSNKSASILSVWVMVLMRPLGISWNNRKALLKFHCLIRWECFCATFLLDSLSTLMITLFSFQILSRIQSTPCKYARTRLVRFEILIASAIQNGAKKLVALVIVYPVLNMLWCRLRPEITQRPPSWTLLETSMPVAFSSNMDGLEIVASSSTLVKLSHHTHSSIQIIIHSRHWKFWPGHTFMLRGRSISFGAWCKYLMRTKCLNLRCAR